jgi:hypothetical protein
MPILVCGAEGEWALFTNDLVATGSDSKRRGSVRIEAGDSMFKAFTGTNDMWFHFRWTALTTGSIGSGGLALDFIQINNASGLLAGVRDSGAANIGAITRYTVFGATSDGGGVVQSSSFDEPALNYIDMDFRVRITTGSNANDTLQIDFYRNGQLRWTRTSIDAGGFGLPTDIELFARRSTNANNYDEVGYQDVIVTDSLPTVGMELAVLVPSAVGVDSDFVNDYTNIDDEGYNPDTVISTTTPGDRESWIFATPTFTIGDKVIYGIALDTVAQTDIALLISDFQPFLRVNATSYNSATTLGANEINPDSYVSVFTLNPDTSQPWVEADLNALEAGVEAT